MKIDFSRAFAGILLFMVPWSECLAFECWKSAVSSVGNVAMVCIGQDRAELHWHFSNRQATGRPANCRVEGRASAQPGDRLEVRLQDGTCDNGREIAGSTLSCRKQARDMVCSLRNRDGSGEEVRFGKVFP